MFRLTLNNSTHAFLARAFHKVGEKVVTKTFKKGELLYRGQSADPSKELSSKFDLAYQYNEKMTPDNRLVTQSDVADHVLARQSLGVPLTSSRSQATWFGRRGYIMTIDPTKCNGPLIDVEKTLQGLSSQASRNAFKEKEFIANGLPKEAVIKIERVGLGS